MTAQQNPNFNHHNTINGRSPENNLRTARILDSAKHDTLRDLYIMATLDQAPLSELAETYEVSIRFAKNVISFIDIRSEETAPSPNAPIKNTKLRKLS